MNWRPLCLILIAAPAAAHDFWLQPARFAVAPGDTVPFTILVGHGPDRGRWQGARARVLRFEQIGPKGARDALTGLTLQGPNADATLRFAEPGTHMVVMATNHAVSDLPALRFNDYAKVEGLTPILDARARAGTTTAPGREIYSRRAKTLVQVGAPRSDVMRAAGLTLEIVPQLNPYALKAGEALPVRVVFETKPLGGALVKLVNLDFDAKPIAERRTAADGIARFDIPRTGRWQLNVVWSKPLAGHPTADFDTIFSSLTFGDR